MSEPLKTAADTFLNHRNDDFPGQPRCIDMMTSMLTLVDSDAGKEFLQENRREMQQKTNLADALLNFLKMAQHAQRTGTLPADEDTLLVLSAIKDQKSNPLLRAQRLFDDLSADAGEDLLRLQQKVAGNPAAMPARDVEQASIDLERSCMMFEQAAQMAGALHQQFSQSGLKREINKERLLQTRDFGKAG